MFAVVFVSVAPARERGLKLDFVLEDVVTAGRSREGAWIEISQLFRRFCLH